MKERRMAEQEHDRSLFQRELEAAREACPPSLWTAAWEKGASMQPEEVVDFAMGFSLPG